MNNRNKIAARIRALCEKTVANGCTEGEAAAAAEMVAELLSKYNLTLDECQMRENGFSRAEHYCYDPVGERLWKIADGISQMIGVRYWNAPPGHPAMVTFFGFDHEVEIATYLINICRNAMGWRMAELEWEYRLLRKTAMRRRIAPFLDGMADRLRARLIELKPEEPTGTGLIVLKDQLIDAELERQGVNLKDQRARQSRSYEPEYARGQLAGDNVALSQGIRADAAVARIAAQ